MCLKNPNVGTVVRGASRPAQVTENMKALDLAPRLTRDVMERIDAILDNVPKAARDEVRHGPCVARCDSIGDSHTSSRPTSRGLHQSKSNSGTGSLAIRGTREQSDSRPKSRSVRSRTKHWQPPEESLPDEVRAVIAAVVCERTGSADSLPTMSSNRLFGRGRLPACVVRIRFSRCMATTPVYAAILLRLYPVDVQRPPRKWDVVGWDRAA